MDYKLRRLPDYSEKTLLEEIKKVAARLGKDTLSREEFKQYARVNPATIVKRFGSWAAALDKAGLRIKFASYLQEEVLLVEIGEVWDRLGRQPTNKEMAEYGRFPGKSYSSKFGSWQKALEKFIQYKEKAAAGENIVHKEFQPRTATPKVIRARGAHRVEYGEPIEFLGLRHAPINEQGVVYLFGKLSEQLGFIIEAIRSEFPDCEGKRQIRGKNGRWERVSIEFEYKSSQFKDHGHKVEECDIIVCWEDDWEDCPLEVISLKKNMQASSS